MWVAGGNHIRVQEVLWALTWPGRAGIQSRFNRKETLMQQSLSTRRGRFLVRCLMMITGAILVGMFVSAERGYAQT
jgi:hypothetical protein